MRARMAAAVGLAISIETSPVDGRQASVTFNPPRLSEANMAQSEADNPSIAGLVALRSYLADDFEVIDAALRNLDQAKLAELDGYIRLATYGLFELPSLRGVVYRGATLPDAAIANYVPGTVVFEHAFIRTTTDPARRFPGNVTFVIASINGRDVSGVAPDREAREVLFFTGTRFKVLAVETDDVFDHRVIYLAEIPDRRLLQGYNDEQPDTRTNGGPAQ